MEALTKILSFSNNDETYITEYYSVSKTDLWHE